MQSHWIPDDHYNAIIGHLTPVDQCLVALLRSTGYRVDDVLTSRRWQWRGNAVTLKERKTGKSRTIFLSPQARKIVEQYGRLARYPSDSLLSYFVPGRRGRPSDRGKLHRTTIWRHFEAAVSAAGLDGNGYSIHSLRKCYAVDKLREYMSLERVQSDLGHKYLSTTMIYVKDALRLV